MHCTSMGLLLRDSVCSKPAWHCFGLGTAWVCRKQKQHAYIAMQGEDEEDESNELVNQVLDEIGVNLDSELVKAPGQKQATTQAVAAEPEAIGTSAAVGGDGIDDDLQARLNNLRKQ